MSVLWRQTSAIHILFCGDTNRIDDVAAAVEEAAAVSRASPETEARNQAKAKSKIVRTGVTARDKMRELLAESLAMALPEAVCSYFFACSWHDVFNLMIVPGHDTLKVSKPIT